MYDYSGEGTEHENDARGREAPEGLVNWHPKGGIRNANVRPQISIFFKVDEQYCMLLYVLHRVCIPSYVLQRSHTSKQKYCTNGTTAIMLSTYTIDSQKVGDRVCKFPVIC